AFSGKTMATLFDQILNRDPEPLASLNPQAPHDLSHIIGKALEKDRDLRYRSAADILADLKRLRRDLVPRRSSDSAVDARPSEPPAPWEEGRRRRRGRGEGAPRPPWRRPWLIFAAVALSYSLWHSRRGDSRVPSKAISFDQLEVTQLTSSGN